MEGSLSSSVQNPLPAGTKLNNGQYEIIKVLGCGGFGITYLGRDLYLQDYVAIKEYFPSGIALRMDGYLRVAVTSAGGMDFYSWGLTRFLEEAQTLAKHRTNPGVVNILTFFVENDTGYIVMEYLNGSTIQDWLKRRGGSVSAIEAFHVLMPVMDTLKELHENNILHRDISPDNIYYCSNGQVKLLDFGAARHFYGEHNQSLSVILKPGYAPVEQYSSNGNQGPWTDIYAVAATYYRMVMGYPMQDALDRVQSEVGIRSNRAVTCCSTNEYVDSVLQKALSIKPVDRYQNINEFQQDLIFAITHNPEREPVREILNDSNDTEDESPSYKKCSDFGTAFDRIFPNPPTSNTYSAMRKLRIIKLLGGAPNLLTIIVIGILMFTTDILGTSIGLGACIVCSLVPIIVMILYYNIDEMDNRQLIGIFIGFAVIFAAVFGTEYWYHQQYWGFFIWFISIVIYNSVLLILGHTYLKV